MLQLSIPSSAMCPSLNIAIRKMANKYVPDYKVSDDAPSSFRSLCEWMDAGNQMAVFSGGSEHTIFGDPGVNYAFRAWHDWVHWQHRFDFSLVGEMFTCNVQIEQLLSTFSPKAVTEWVPYLTAEVIGQRLYFEKYREYIVDQRAFVSAYLNDSTDALKRKW